MKHLLNLITILKTNKNLNNINFIKTKETIELVNLLFSEGYTTFNNIVILSKPGRRKFITSNKIWTIDRGLGTTIIKTSKGLKTSHQARLLNLGGELLIKII